jgi:non-canonical purine NTP pyrophosphatase (RdgB/HAM1 family)
MKEIVFATSNNGKIASLKGYIAAHDLDISIIQQPLDLIEPQANTAAEVAAVKARQAYEILKKPVLVDDSSFHIVSLGGFPGPYIKYMLETVKIEGILELMEGKTDRRAYFASSLVFVDDVGEIHAFDGQDPVGEIVTEIDTGDHEHAWSDLWKIFSPPGFDGKTYSQFTDDDFAVHRVEKDTGSAYEAFAKWLEEGAAV